MDSKASTNLTDLDETEFCQWLKEQKFKPDVVTAFEEADVDGSAFLCITEQDMKDMGLKIGPIRKLLTLQSKYKPNETQVSKSMIYKDRESVFAQYCSLIYIRKEPDSMCIIT